MMIREEIKNSRAKPFKYNTKKLDRSITRMLSAITPMKHAINSKSDNDLRAAKGEFRRAILSLQLALEDLDKQS